MKLTNYLAMALLAGLLLIGGCPRGDGAGDDDGTAAESVEASAVTPPVQTTDSSPPVDVAEVDESAEPADEPEAVVDDGEADVPVDEDPPPDDENGATQAQDETAGAGSGVFELAGLRIGIAPSVYRVYYDARPDIELFPTWLEQNTTGLVAANMASGSVSYGEVAYFLDGELVGVMRHVEEAAVNYADFTNELERRFGPPSDEPPRWSRVTPFFAGYQKPDPGLVLKFWGNSQTREVFFISRNNQLGGTDYMLCDVDRFEIVSQQIQGMEQPR